MYVIWKIPRKLFSFILFGLKEREREKRVKEREHDMKHELNMPHGQSLFT